MNGITKDQEARATLSDLYAAEIRASLACAAANFSQTALADYKQAERACNDFAQRLEEVGGQRWADHLAILAAYDAYMRVAKGGAPIA